MEKKSENTNAGKLAETPVTKGRMKEEDKVPSCNKAHTHLVPVLTTVEAAHLLSRLKQVLAHLVHLPLQDVEGLGSVICIQPLVILLEGQFYVLTLGSWRPFNVLI